MSDRNMYYGSEDVPTTHIPVPAAPGGPGSRGPGKRPWSPGKRAAALLGVAVVIGGGAFAAVQATTGTPGAAQAASQAVAAQTVAQAATASSTGQAAVLRDVLTTTGIRRLARLRLLGGMYGQFTYETKKGPATLAFERGTITSDANGDVVVRAADGSTQTWVLTGTSVVRENGAKEPDNALATGQAVFVAGPIVSGTRDARVIVIRKAAPAQKTTSAA